MDTSNLGQGEAPLPTDSKAALKPKPKNKPAARSKATVSFVQITCPFCKAFYNNAVTLRCGHTLCHDCLQTLLAGKSLSAFPEGKAGYVTAPSAPTPSPIDETSTATNDPSPTLGPGDADSDMTEGKSASMLPSDQEKRRCPICQETYFVGDLRKYRPSEALNRIVNALVTNLPDHLRKKRAWVQRDHELNPDGFEYVAQVVEKSLKQTKEFLTPLGDKLSKGASEMSVNASVALTASRERTSVWIEQTAVPWFDKVKSNIMRGYESLTTTPDVLMQREAKSPLPSAAASSISGPSVSSASIPSSSGSAEAVPASVSADNVSSGASSVASVVGPDALDDSAEAERAIHVPASKEQTEITKGLVDGEESLESQAPLFSTGDDEDDEDGSDFLGPVDF
eukprot:gb/GEZN01010194.1/.p1 GENE.gb/GEZN01010194.1/~~gb/GEZN01010194.1/.p1  ORF type:complete len:396 (+),score=80.49 gb/GEZN01010194.1/:40-1227(+)